MFNKFVKINTKDADLTSVQNQIQMTLDPVLAKDILSGHLIKDVIITAGQVNKLQHKLDRDIKGYIIVNNDSSAIIYDTFSDDKFLFLNAYTPEVNPEAVVAVYWVEGATSANTSIAAATNEIIDYQHKIYDTHNAVTVGAFWKFVAPYTGYYRVSYSIPFDASAANSTGDGFIYTNGVMFSRGFEIHYNTANWLVGHGSSIVYLTAGQYLDIRATNNDAGAAINVRGTNITKESVAIEKIPDYIDSTSVTISVWVF